MPFLLFFQKPGQVRVLVGTSLPAAQAQKDLPYICLAKASARPSPLPPPHPVLSGYLPGGPRGGSARLLCPETLAPLREAYGSPRFLVVKKFSNNF